MTKSGSPKLVHEFTEAEGKDPTGIVITGDGTLYGALRNTEGKSGYASGSIFRLTQSGQLTTLHAFSGGKEGSSPNSPLRLAQDGKLYGTTSFGGITVGQSTWGLGTIFSVTTDGNVATIHAFSGGEDGLPSGNSLTEGGDGRLYGTTLDGPAPHGAAIYAIDESGDKSTLYRFTALAGRAEVIVRGSDGNFYGVTSGSKPYGSIFRLTLGGTLATLYERPYTGARPNSGLVQGPGGCLYGTADAANALSQGVLYRLDASGRLSILHQFAGSSSTSADLIIGTDGNLYGAGSLGLFRFDLANPVSGSGSGDCRFH